MSIINNLVYLAFVFFINNFNPGGASEFNNNLEKNWRSLEPPAKESKSFLFYKTNSVGELKCICPNSFMCNCCQTVTLMHSLAQKNLCANFRYEKNGLVTDISMDSRIVRSVTISTYRPYRMCTKVPGAMFSSVCLNILELNAFPRSLTVCPRLEIMSHSQEWKLTYTCLSISTELPSSGALLNQPMSTGVTMGGIIVTPMSQSHLLILPVGASGSQSGAMKPAGQNTTVMPQKMPPMMGTPSSQATGDVRMPPKIPGTTTMSNTGTPQPTSPTVMPQGNKPAGNATTPPAGQGTITITQKPPTASTTPKNQMVVATGNKPTQSRHSSFIQIDDKIETIILHSPETDDRSKFFPSRLPPAFEASFNNSTA